MRISVLTTKMGILMPYFSTWHSEPCVRVVLYKLTHQPLWTMRWNCKIQHPRECPLSSKIHSKICCYYYYYYITERFFLILLLNQRWTPLLRLQFWNCSIYPIICGVLCIDVVGRDLLKIFLVWLQIFFLKPILLLLLLLLLFHSGLVGFQRVRVTDQALLIH